MILEFCTSVFSDLVIDLGTLYPCALAKKHLDNLTGRHSGESKILTLSI